MTRSELLEKMISEVRMIKLGLRAHDPLVPLIEPHRYEEYDLLELLLHAEQKRSEGCGYEQIDDDQNIWKCDKCGEEWTLYEGGVIENRMDYCMKCGLPILRVITHGWDDDGNETTTITERDPTEGESV